MIYKGFISYSHAADSQYAAALQSALHRFARPFNRLRALRIFRDQTDLSTNPALWPVIQKTLAASEFFLLLASPKAAQSYWVKREIAHWLHLNQGAADKLLIILTEGEIVWDKTKNDYDWDRTDALPRTIAADSDGNEAVSFGSIFKDEPFYLDQRWAKKSEDLSLRNPQFLGDVATLAATLHGKTKSDMIGEDVNEHKKYRRARTAAMALLLIFALAAAGFGIYANQKRKEAVNALQLAEQRRLGEEQQRQLAQEKAQEAQKQAELAEQSRKEAAEEARIAEERRVEAERERNIAVSRQFAADALAALPTDPARSVEFAHSAFLKANTSQAEEALRRSVAASYLRFVIGSDESEISGAAYSPDGKLIATWYKKGDAMLWDAQTGAKIKKLHGRANVNDLVFSHKGNLLLTMNDDKTATVWDVATGQVLFPLRGEVPANKALFSPDDSIVITYLYSMVAWDTRTGKQIWKSGSLIGMHSVSFSHNGRFLVTSHEEGTVDVWDTQTGKVVQEFSSRKKRKTADIDAVSAVFSPDDRFILAAAVDGAARVWDIHTGVLQRLLSFSDEEAESAQLEEQAPEPLPRKHRNDEINIPQPHGLHIALFNRDGTIILTANDNLVRTWDMETGKKLTELKNHVLLKNASFSHNGKYVLTCGVDNVARIWEAITGRLVAELRGHTEPILDATFAPNDERVLTLSDDRTARVWDSGLGKLKTTLTGHQDGLIKAAYSPDGKFVVTVAADKSVRIWNANSGVEVRRLETNESQALNASFSPDGTRIVTALLAERDPGEKYTSPLAVARVWDARSGKKIFDLDGKVRELPFKIVYSPDGSLIAASCDDGTVHIWDANTARFIAQTGKLDDGGAYDLSFSPDSRYLVTLDGIPRIWESRTGFKVGELVGHMGIVNTARYSTDGRLMVSTSDDNTARIWDLATLKWKTLKGHGGRVIEGIFSPDTKYVLTTSVDGSVRVWDVQTAESIITLRESYELEPLSSFFPSVIVTSQGKLTGMMPGGINDASFSPDSKFVAVAKQDGTVDLMDISAKKVIAQFQRHAAPVTSISFSPDGKYLLTSSLDNTALIYECEPCRSAAELRNLATQRIIPQLNGHAPVALAAEDKELSWLHLYRGKMDHSYIKHVVDDVIFDDLALGFYEDADRNLRSDRPVPVDEDDEDLGVSGDLYTVVFDHLDAKFGVKIPRSGDKRPKTVGDLYLFIESQVRRKVTRRHY